MGKTSQTSCSTATENRKLYIYLGVTVKGYIQNGDMFLANTREEALQQAERAISAYGLIEKFIVPVEEIAITNQKIQRGDNLLANDYRQLAKIAGSRGNILF